MRTISCHWGTAILCRAMPGNGEIFFTGTQLCGIVLIFSIALDINGLFGNWNCLGNILC